MMLLSFGCLADDVVQCLTHNLSLTFCLYWTPVFANHAHIPLLLLMCDCWTLHPPPPPHHRHRPPPPRTASTLLRLRALRSDLACTQLCLLHNLPHFPEKIIKTKKKRFMQDSQFKSIGRSLTQTQTQTHVTLSPTQPSVVCVYIIIWGPQSHQIFHVYFGFNCYSNLVFKSSSQSAQN